MVCECPNEKYFIFDKEDYDKIKNYFWNFNNKGSVITHINRKVVMLKRFLLDVTDPSKKVLIRNKDNTDYRKQNLFYGNIYKEYEDYYEGECFDGQKFKIDKEDYEKIKPYVWHVDSNGYVIGKVNGEVFKQHRFILNLSKTDKREVDHIYHDQLDNRKKNLRIVNRSQNCQNERIPSSNSSGVKGIYKQKGYDKWMVQINNQGKRYYLGSYANLDEAIKVRKEAEQKMHGEYAYKG